MTVAPAPGPGTIVMLIGALAEAGAKPVSWPYSVIAIRRPRSKTLIMTTHSAADQDSRISRRLPEHILMWCESLEQSRLKRILRPGEEGEWTLLARSDYEKRYYCPAIAERELLSASRRRASPTGWNRSSGTR